MNESHHARLAQAGGNAIHAAELEGLDHSGRGIDLLETELRVLVQIAPKRGELGMKLSNGVKGHAGGAVSQRLRLKHGLRHP
jgi:hypothetical protein